MTAAQEQKIEKLKRMSRKEGGLITTAQIEREGISRTLIPFLMRDGILVREGHGTYCFADDVPDDYYLIQKRSEKLIYSFGTALFFWGMSDRTPHMLDFTVPQGYNVSRIKKGHGNVRFHYVPKTQWAVGITETKTPYGSNIRLYDRERCIVDLVKKKDDMEKQLYLQAIREYFADERADVNKLLRYAKIFHVEIAVRDYTDILGS